MFVTLVTLEKFFKKINGWDRALVIFFVLGIVITGISLLRGILVDRQVQVEYVTGDKVGNETKIFVDVEGSVINPGVYELFVGSRIKDALVSAGGMSETADRQYCEKNLNLAEIVKDGDKIYIPKVGVSPAQGGYIDEGIVAKKINLNTAGVAELDTLWGVGAARIESIVKNRPYKNLDEVVTKGGMTKTIFEKNKALLSVF